MGIETAAMIAAAAETAAAATAATAATAGTAGALAGTAATAAGAAGAGAGTAAALGGAELAAGAVAAETAAATGAAAAAGGVSPASLAFANTVSTFGGDGLSALIAAEGGFGSTSTMMGAASDMFANTAVGEVASQAASQEQEQEQPAQRPAPNTGPAISRPNQNPGLTQASGLMNQGGGSDYLNLDSLLPMSGFQNGGIVQDLFPNNIFSSTRDRREQEAGLSGGGVTINVNAGSGQSQSQSQQPKRVPDEGGNVVQQFADQVLSLIRGDEQKAGYQDGGKVRSGASDIKAGGEIRGPESKDGRDNQVIKVAGGEGIIPKDVMDMPGMSDFVQHLIQTFHTPIK